MREPDPEPIRGAGRVSDMDVTAHAPPTRSLPAHRPGVEPAELDVVVARPAFDDFYRMQRDAVARALALTLRDADLAAEATDEAMARAYQRWVKVRTLDNPAGWVYRVGLNWSVSFLRRLHRPAPRWVTGDGTSPAPTVQDPAIDDALAQLSVDHRAVVVCRLLLGWSEAQTATALHIRPGTVKSRLHRAVERLERLLAPLHDPEEDTAR